MNAPNPNFSCELCFVESPNIPSNSVARSPGAKLKMSLETYLPDLVNNNRYANAYPSLARIWGIASLKSINIKQHNWAGWRSGNFPDYSPGAQFESPSRHRLAWVRFWFILQSPSRQILEQPHVYVKFEALKVVNMKNSMFWDTTPYNQSKVNRSFGGKFRLRLQGGRINQSRNRHDVDSALCLLKYVN
jgi:hypothetical protein